MGERSERSLTQYSCCSATHCVKFVAKGQRVVSFGDDQSIKCWDLADMGAIPVVAFPGAHADHVRCGDVAHTSDHLLVSGKFFTWFVFDIRY